MVVLRSLSLSPSDRRGSVLADYTAAVGCRSQLLPGKSSEKKPSFVSAPPRKGDEPRRGEPPLGLTPRPEDSHAPLVERDGRRLSCFSSCLYLSGSRRPRQARRGLQ